MSDSDETVCGNESADENTQNSPSILSNWHEEETVFSTEKDEETPKKSSVNEREEIIDGMDRMVESPESEISPEFPLIPRGLKRKDGPETDLETDEATLIVQSVTNSTQLPVLSSVESENISNATTRDTQTTDDETRLERLLKNVEDFVKDMELKSERDESAGNLEDLQTVKCQLEDVQKLLGESNRKNQARRKVILPEAENSPQLSEEKKLVIVNLAKKQRNLLEAFKKYKNLVQRLKTMKDLNSTSKSLSKDPSSSSKQRPDGSLKILSHKSSQSISTASNTSMSTAPRIVMTNATNPSLTKAIQHGSVKFIILQNQSKKSSTASMAHSDRPSGITVGADAASLVSGFGQTAFTPSVSQSVPAHNTITTVINNKITSKQPSVTLIQPNRATTTQVSLAKTLSHTSTTNSLISTPRQTQQTTGRLPANQVQTIGVSVTNFPRSKTSQSTASMPYNASNLELSLETLVKKGVLIPGKNVLTTKSEGKLYSASLSDKGTIISAGGEGFASPRSWVKAILGSKRKVKNEQAWRMVSYKDKPLLDHAIIVPSEPETSVNLNVESSKGQGTTSRRDTSRELINTTSTLKALLSNCRVIGITRKEILSLEKTQEEFWDDMDDDILKALDF